MDQEPNNTAQDVPVVAAQPRIVEYDPITGMRCIQSSKSCTCRAYDCQIVPAMAERSLSFTSPLEQA